MIVVDSNVVAYLYLPGAYTGKAEALLEHDADWAAPLLWRSEFRNILAGYMRRKTLTFEAARDLQLEAESLLAGVSEQEPAEVIVGPQGLKNRTSRPHGGAERTSACR